MFNHLHICCSLFFPIVSTTDLFIYSISSPLDPFDACSDKLNLRSKRLVSYIVIQSLMIFAKESLIRALLSSSRRPLLEQIISYFLTLLIAGEGGGGVLADFPKGFPSITFDRHKF